MNSASMLSEPADVLYRIKRGLSGYVSYLAACEMNESFSEYILYEPILRILTARNYSVECEVECPGLAQPVAGDRKRLDFVATRRKSRLAVEVKWARSRRLDVTNDHGKLQAFLASGAAGTDRAFLCVFGRESVIGNVTLMPNVFREQGKPVTASLGVTKFGCRIFELSSKAPKNKMSLQPTSRGRSKAKGKKEGHSTRG